MSWIHEAHQEALTIIRAIGLDPSDMIIGATSVDGDTLTYEELVRDEGGNKTLDGSGYRKRTRTYRLHPAEPIEEPA